MNFPLLNAFLNGTSAVLLLSGLAAIKAGRRELHERLMLTTLAVSVAFLASYCWYHFAVLPHLGVTKFNRVGWVRPAYYAMLASHVILAVAVVPLALRTVFLARRERWVDHKRLAKIAFPIWLYVSVTGVLVYLCLYAWNAPAR